MKKWSWKLGRLAGIDTYVHASFLLLIGWAAWSSWSGAGTLASVVYGVAFLLAVFGSVLLHELGHALMARRYGIATQRIVLYPIGGVAQLERMPRRPREELAVALAGPAVNFTIAAALWLFAPVFGAGVLGALLGSLMVANLMLGAFNLVPAYPMDGGRALRAFLAERMGSRRATETAVKVGRWVAGGMVLLGLFTGNVLLVLIAAFVWFAGGAELRASRTEAFEDEVEVLDVPMRRARAPRPGSRRTSRAPSSRAPSWIHRVGSVRPGRSWVRTVDPRGWERLGMDGFDGAARGSRWVRRRPPTGPSFVRFVVVRRMGG